MWLMKRRGLLIQTLILFSIAMLTPACEVVPVVAAVPAPVSLPTGTPTRVSVVAPMPLPVMVTAANFKPEAALMTYPAWTRRVVCESNAAYSQNPLPGKMIRFQTPIDINPNGLPQVLDAIKNYEAMTSGAVTFRIVNSDPTVGIVVVEGDALTRDGQPGCGHVTHQRDPKSGFTFNVTNDGTINSRLYVHLGSSACNHTREGFQPQSIAEHELGHALGLGTHFAGFTGIEGLTLELLVTVMALYRTSPGTDISQMCAAG
jgi:hypothetical protein